MFWNQKKKKAPRSEADLYADALDSAFRVPKAAPVPMPKAAKPPRSAPKWLRPTIMGLTVLCLVATVLIWALARRPSRETEHYLCLTVIGTSKTHLYGFDEDEVFWRIDPGNADFDLADARRDDVIWIFFDGEGEQIEEIYNAVHYSHAATARDLHLCRYDEPPANLQQYGLLFDTVRFDIDDDGMAETCRLFAGPTSGMVTYELIAFGSFGLPEKRVVFFAPNAEQDPAFYVDNGALQILYVNMPFASVPGVQQRTGAWDVRMEDGEMVLYAGNKQLDRLIDGELIRGTEPPTIPSISAMSFSLYLQPLVGTENKVTSDLLELPFEQANELLRQLGELDWRSTTTYICVGDFTLYVGGSTFVYQFMPTGILVCGDQHVACPQELWDQLMLMFAVVAPNQQKLNVSFVDQQSNSVSIAINGDSHTDVVNGKLTELGRCLSLGDFLILSFEDSADLVTLRRESDHAVFHQTWSSTKFRLADGSRLSLSSYRPHSVAGEQGVLFFSLADPIARMEPVDTAPPQATESDRRVLTAEDTVRLEYFLNNLKWHSQSQSSQVFFQAGTLYWTCGGTTKAIGFEADGTLLWNGNYTHLSASDWRYLWGLLQGVGKDMPEAIFSNDSMTLRFSAGGIAMVEQDGVGTTMEYLRCGDRVLLQNSEQWLLLSMRSEDRLILTGCGDSPAGLFSGELLENVPTLQLWLPGMDEQFTPPEAVLSDEQEMELLLFLGDTFRDSNPQTVEKTGGKAILRGYGYTYELYFDNDHTLIWAVGNEGVTEQLTYAKWQQFLQFLFPASEQQGSRYRTLTDQGFLYISLKSGGTAEIYDGGRSLMGRWLQKGGILYVTVKELIAPGDTAVALPQIFVFRSTGYGGYRYAAELSDQATWQLSDEQLFEQIYIYG